MALAVAHSRGLDGMQAPPVLVEAHIASGLPSFTLVGLPDTEVKEARDRVRAAIVNSGFEFPAKRITVNLAPADLPKIQNILLFETDQRYLRMVGAICDQDVGD